MTDLDAWSAALAEFEASVVASRQALANGTQLPALVALSDRPLPPLPAELAGRARRALRASADLERDLSAAMRAAGLSRHLVRRLRQPSRAHLITTSS
jgi:hypothetical protein